MTTLLWVGQAQPQESVDERERTQMQPMPWCVHSVWVGSVVIWRWDQDDVGVTGETAADKEQLMKTVGVGEKRKGAEEIGDLSPVLED